MRGRPQPLSGQLKFCRFFFGHYIGQKVHSGSSVRYYGITRVNFWANTVLLFLIVSWNSALLTLKSISPDAASALCPGWI